MPIEKRRGQGPAFPLNIDSHAQCPLLACCKQLLSAPKREFRKCRFPKSLPLFFSFSFCQVQLQGFQGGKVASELFRRWKVLLSEGGEELQMLQAREAELRQSPEEKGETLRN